MKRYQYTSKFAADMDAFIDFKASVGIASNSRNWTLYDFDRYCVEHGLTQFNRQTVEGWVINRKAMTSPNHLTWVSHIRELGRFMNASGNEGAYILSDDFKAKMVRIQPYLLTQAEVGAFFAAAVEYKDATPWTWQAACFFGLMHSCGLRPCEVRRLQRSNVHPEAGEIDIMWSKGHRSRKLAITDEVAKMVALCDTKTSAAFGSERPALFISSTGNPVASSAIGIIFHRIWESASLPAEKGGKHPRPYAFRHRFAYANIERWRRDGVDVAAMLPYLAKYMGHSTFDSTYYYIHTSPDFFDEYADIVADTDLLLPEVGFDE